MDYTVLAAWLMAHGLISAYLQGVDLTDTNCYATSFDGADLRDAQFENAILSSTPPPLTSHLRPRTPL